jgi:hypothetical protein
MTQKLKPILTKDANGAPNGYVLPIWNSAFDAYRPEQVYLTTIVVGSQKGPHLHMTRAGAFTTTRGNVLIVTRVDGKYREYLTGEGHHKTVFVEAGTPCCLYNIGPVEAFVLNMPVPAWRDDSDEHKVDDWDYVLDYWHARMTVDELTPEGSV